MTTAAGISTTTVSTTAVGALAPLGFRLTVPAPSGSDDNENKGEQVWVYVKAVTALAVGDICIRDPSAHTGTKPLELVWGAIPAASGTVYPAYQIVGVAQHVIALGSFGFVQCKGVGLVKTGTADITTDLPMTTGGSRAGAAIDYADGATTRHAVFGFSLEAETDTTTFDCWLNCLGA